MRRTYVGVAVVVALLTASCGSSDSLTDEEIRSALEDLPFEYEYREVSYSGDGAVVAGVARLDGHATHFAVIDGSPEIDGRVIPRQRRPDGTFQRGVDTSTGSGLTVKFVYTSTSIPRVSAEIDLAMCLAATDDDDGCRDV